MSIRLTRAELERHWPEQAKAIFAEDEAKRTRREIEAPPPVAVSTLPILRPVEPGERGPWTCTVPGWLPANLNQYLRQHWSQVSKAKKETAETILVACIADRIPRATRKRKVSVRLSIPKGRRPPDEDNIQKSLRDGLVRAGALVDDSHEWCETGPFEVVVGKLATIVILEDV